MRKVAVATFLLTTFLMVVFCRQSSAQATAISWQVTYQGSGVPYASVRICPITSSGTPCTPLASLYYDYGLTNAAPNPLTTDQYGNFTVYAANLGSPSFYLIQITPSSGVTWTYSVNAANGILAIPVTVSEGGTGVTSFTPNELVASGSTSTSPLVTLTALPNGTTATTQSSGDSSTKVATDAFVSTATGQGCLGGNTIANGCTSATTSSAAATAIVNGNTVKPSNSATGVTPEVNVAYYGAVGDCTQSGSTSGCTDNHTAIQNAINEAYAIGGTVLIPPNPASMGTTIYYVSSALNPKGVSIHGPLGAGTGFFTNKVGIRGAPSKDVFAVGDPSSGGYVTPDQSFVIQDLELVVDDSVNASSSFPHRLPGKTCHDITFTNESAVVTSTAQCEFNQGDVGQQFTGTDGTYTLTGTIASVPIVGAGAYSTTATLSAEWTHATTSGNSTLYVSVMDMPVTNTVGNVAFSYDDTGTVCSSGGPNQAVFRNLGIVTTSGTEQNNSGAFFFQGTCGQPYASTWDNIFSRTQWGFVAVESDGIVAQNGAMGDLNHFNNWFNESNYPLLTYDGSFTRWDGGQLASALFGPQILTYNEPENENQPIQWIVRNEEFENAGATGPAYGGWRIEGWLHRFVNDSFSYNSTITSQWDAYASECNQCTVSSPLNLTGALNRIQITNASSATAVNDTGFRNLCSEGYQVNAFNSQQPALFQACSAVNSRQNIAFAHTAAFVANGDETTPYNNQDDLWIWPQDMYDNVGVNLTSSVVADSASETGAYLTIPASGGWSISYLNNSAITIGPSNMGANLPATEVHVCFRIKSLSGTPSLYLQLYANSTPVLSMNKTLSTTYATYCGDANLTSYSGDTAYFEVGSPANSAALAWISVHPWSNNINTTGQMQSTEILGPSTAPSGSCSVNGQWEMTQDGSITKCVSGTWTTFASSNVLSGTTGSIGGSALTVNNCATGTASITGATTSMHVFGITPTSDPNGSTTQDYDWYGSVTSSGTVTVKVCAIVAGTPAATTYKLLVQ